MTVMPPSNMQFNYKSEDGEVDLIRLETSKDLKTIILGTPRKGTSCSFKIINFQKISTEYIDGEKASNKIPLAPSTYLSSDDTAEPGNRSGVVGFTSTSEFDRLLDVCLTRLHVGESGQFLIKCFRSESSYNFTLELVEIHESFELYDLSPDRVEELTRSLKDAGILLFSNGYAIDAFYKFSEAFKLCSLAHPRTRKSAQVNFISTLQSNMASCHVKLGNWENAIDLCNAVIEQDPNNVKALFRRGVSLIEIQEYEKAMDDLQRAKQLDPDNQAVRTKLVLLDEKNKALNAKYAQAMKKFFS